MWIYHTLRHHSTIYCWRAYNSNKTAATKTLSSFLDKESE
jgi:hypothetical protein